MKKAGLLQPILGQGKLKEQNKYSVKMLSTSPIKQLSFHEKMLRGLSCILLNRNGGLN
jgi:hypothetical protein